VLEEVALFIFVVIEVRSVCIGSEILASENEIEVSEDCSDFITLVSVMLSLEGKQLPDIC